MKQKRFKFFGREKSIRPVEELQLVAGVFTPAEGADVLLSLINYKIKYHNVQLRNLKVGPQAAIEKSQQRIQELKEAKKRVTHLLLEAKNKGFQLDISSAITIKNVRADYSPSA